MEEVAVRVAAVVRGIPRLEAPTKGLDWSLGQTAAHLVAAVDQNAQLVAGNREPHQVAGIADLNNERLAQVDAATPEALAEAITAATAELTAAARAHPAGATVRWLNGVEQDLGTVLGVVLGELLIHGFDIARSVGHRWEIRRQHAALVIAAALPIMPMFVHQRNAAGFKGSFGVRLRGGIRFTASFDDGVLTINPPGQTGADCHISADPVAMLLINYGRVNQWGQLARGKMLSWGRKPWLGLRFKSLLIDP